jgi:transcriptional regulator with XRE-family HTH domain
MAEDEQRAEWGDFITFLRWLGGIDSQADFARKTGIARSEINRYEQGKQKPQRATLQQMMEGIGVPWRLFNFLRWSHRLIRKAHPLGATLGTNIEAPPSDSGLSEGDKAAVLGIVERALAMGRAEQAALRSQSERLKRQS